MIGLDLDTSHQKGRWIEIIVRDHFEKDSIDLSGNPNIVAVILESVKELSYQ